MCSPTDLQEIKLHQWHHWSGYRMWIKALGELRQVHSISSTYDVYTDGGDRWWCCHGDTPIFVDTKVLIC